jgi:hypothetical protein
VAIENRCHWVLDVVFHEDQSRVRKDHGPADPATLRSWVPTLLRQEASTNSASRHTAWDLDYLLRLFRFAAPHPAEDRMRSPWQPDQGERI